MLFVIDNDEQLKRKAEIMQSVMGIAEISTIALLAGLPELGKVENRHISALVGSLQLTDNQEPNANKARIGGGRKRLRTALYMPALVAIRYNTELKARYEHLLEQGKQKRKSQL